MAESLNQPQQIVVPAGIGPARLDVFLARHTDISRSTIQKHIRAGQVLVNGKTRAAHDKVRAGDVIELHDITANYHETIAADAADAPTIIAEDDNYLVVDKPSGLLVHGGPSFHESTLADWAAARDPQIKIVGDDPAYRPGVVHRLDRDVSGLMVIAKTPAAYADLKRQFQNHDIEKEYLALVHGRVVDEHGRIDFAIARKADHSGLMVARPKSTEGKAAETRFHVDRYIKNMTLLKVQTLTGRMHQIRVHFKAIGHPLVGDPLYRQRKLKVAKLLVPPRLFLHAQRLAFTDLNGQRREYVAPLSTDLRQYLERIS
jgi:23S rRNA pseudouridine1911/1915/1917 synthase